jgi:hypothetical protein
MRAERFALMNIVSDFIPLSIKQWQKMKRKSSRWRIMQLKKTTTQKLQNQTKQSKILQRKLKQNLFEESKLLQNSTDEASTSEKNMKSLKLFSRIMIDYSKLKENKLNAFAEFREILQTLFNTRFQKQWQQSLMNKISIMQSHS